MRHYDAIVIGGGAAGLSAALTIAGCGRKTLLVEKYKTGGECTWSGCIPSKTLIHLAELAHAARLAGAEPAASPAPLKRVDEVRQAVYSHESPEVLAGKGVETLIGTARFISRDTIEVGGEPYKAKYFVLAIGSRPLIPPIPGLAETPYLTNENLFNLEQLPKDALVIGGGPIGLELAQALSRLGVGVTVVEMLDRVLFREDVETAKVIEEQLRFEGVRLITGARVTEATKKPGGITLKTEKKETDQLLEAEALLVAVGRQSAVEGLNLEAAGVKASPKGVEVDRTLRTANRRIYAAGDAVGPYAFSHMAEYQGVKAGLNIVLPVKTRTHYAHVAWTTFTDPEIAAAGLTEEAAREKYGKSVRVYTQRCEDSDRGRTAGGSKGLVKIIVGKRNRILGAHIAGPRAGELICEVQVLKTLGIGYHKLYQVIHPYPTYAEILRQISKRVRIDYLMDLWPTRLFRALKGGK